LVNCAPVLISTGDINRSPGESTKRGNVNARTVRNVIASVLTGSALMLTACSSSTGNASVSQQQIENTLKKDSQITVAKAKLSGDKYDKFISCLAQALKKDASGSDVDAYVHGKKKLGSIKGNKGAATKDATACTKAALGTS
jgi:hypothetical protein